MELRHLKYFLKVAEELNFSKAADKLFISQPPLSRQIKELELELGARLFNRNNKRVELTEAGKYFQKEIKDLLNSLDKITITTAKIAKNVSGSFRIAYISSTYSDYITELIKYLSGIYPFVKFKLYEVPTAKQIAALEQGKLDLGIIRAPLQSPRLKSEVWFRDTYSLVYNKNYLHIKSENDLAKLAHESFIFFNKEYSPVYYNTLLEICSKYGFTPNVLHELNNIGSIIQLIKSGLGVSILPYSISKNYNFNEIAFLELKKIELYTEVLLATQREQTNEIITAAVNYLLNKAIKFQIE